MKIHRGSSPNVTMRIALDAMGGDTAPAETVSGALSAVQSLPDATVLLVGNEPDLREELERVGAPDDPRLPIVHAVQRVGMGERPVEAIKRKPDSSILRAVQLVAEGEAEAVVSAGTRARWWRPPACS